MRGGKAWGAAAGLGSVKALMHHCPLSSRAPPPSRAWECSRMVMAMASVSFSSSSLSPLSASSCGDCGCGGSRVGWVGACKRCWLLLKLQGPAGAALVPCRPYLCTQCHPSMQEYYHCWPPSLTLHCPPGGASAAPQCRGGRPGCMGAWHERAWSASKQGIEGGVAHLQPQETMGEFGCWAGSPARPAGGMQTSTACHTCPSCPMACTDSCPFLLAPAPAGCRRWWAAAACSQQRMWPSSWRRWGPPPCPPCCACAPPRRRRARQPPPPAPQPPRRRRAPPPVGWLGGRGGVGTLAGNAVSQSRGRCAMGGRDAGVRLPL